MTLAFSTQLNGNKTYFPEKILFGLEHNKIIQWDEMCHLMFEYFTQPFRFFEEETKKHSPKIHTIRTDEKNKWKPGNLIHFIINNRTKDRYQFAPVIKVVSIQQIVIKWGYEKKTERFTSPMVLIDGKEIKGVKLALLAKNDGFNNTEDFFNYFNSDFTGKLIHWTSYKY